MKARIHHPPPTDHAIANMPTILRWNGHIVRVAESAEVIAVSPRDDYIIVATFIKSDGAKKALDIRRFFLKDGEWLPSMKGVRFSDDLVTLKHFVEVLHDALNQITPSEG